MIENPSASAADTGPGEGVIAADDTGLLRGEQLIAEAEIDEQLESPAAEIEPLGGLEAPEC
jgi:hypothetical protein